MRRAISLSIISVVLSFFSTSQEAISQSSTIFWIHISDTYSPADTATMVFGNHDLATYDIDLALGELAAPPDPPYFFTRWLGIPGRPKRADSTYGLLYKDLRDIPVDFSKEDTFYLKIQNADGGGQDSVTFSWPDSTFIFAKCDSMVLMVKGDTAGASGIPGGRLNMSTTNTATILNPYKIPDDGGWNQTTPALRIFIFKYGYKPCYCDQPNDLFTWPASNVTSISATLNGQIDVICSPVVSVKFQYGTTTSYENLVPAIYSGDHYSLAVGNLLPNARYHFRLYAKFQDPCTGGIYPDWGPDQTFTTDPPSSIFWIHINDTHASNDTATLIFGNHIYATYDVDSQLGEHPCGEWPPAFHVEWNSIPGRINTWGGWSGALCAKDLREIPLNPAKKDSFYLRVYNGDVIDSDKIVLTWPDSNYISSRTDSMILVVVGDTTGRSGIPHGRINMSTTPSIVILNPYTTTDNGGWNATAPNVRIHIFKYGTKMPLLDAVKKENAQPPNEFRLEQNYPNPFNPETRFEFGVSRFEFVTLKVYDVLGREVATIVNEELPPGEYTRTWDAKGVPSGVYLYRLTAGRIFEMKKLVIVR